MAIGVRWYNPEHTVILLEFLQQWAWSELVTAQQEAEALIDTVEHPCALFLTAPPKVIAPPNVLSNAVEMFRHRHERIEMIVLIVANPFVQALMSVFMRVSSMASRYIRLVSSWEEAHEKLIEVGYLQPEWTK